MPPRQRNLPSRRRNISDSSISKQFSKSDKKKAKSVVSVNETVQSLPSVSDADCAGVSHDRVLSPEKLVQRLDHFCNDLALNSRKSGYCDLVDFDVEQSAHTLDKLKELREQMHDRLSAFDREGKTDINYDGAAIAGAKVVIDEGLVATRSITKKLADGAGIDEFDLLYKGLPYQGSEISATKEIHEQRTDSIIESFVDFQKQLQFKLKVLNHAIKKMEIKGNSKSAAGFDRLSKRKATFKKRKSTLLLLDKAAKTPKKIRKVDPLAFSRIIDQYALEVASDIVGEDEEGPSRMQCSRRNLAPIPFNLDILDDETENENPRDTV
ncbi:hypothetical protein Ddc_07144 [Ditylenchus destructor]|nr:hypothetical protein Ddc_07144 [Ditylenchus destructor]